MAGIKNIKVISRNPDHYLRDTNLDIHKIQRNYNPDLHPLQAAREYKLALNAVKLERVFAKPFLCSLTHSESVSALAKHPHRLSYIFSGTVQGDVTLWNIQTRRSVWSTRAHQGQVWSVAPSPDGQSFFTVGNDKTIKRWALPDIENLQDAGEAADLPLDTWLSSTVVTGITHHRQKPEFITCGERVLLWDATCKAPKTSYDWTTTGNRNEASGVCVTFNPVEQDLFASSDYSNNLILYDTRAKEVKKLKMLMRINALAWNPMEAFMLTAASEDYNCYTFDIRKLDHNNRIVGLHRGHTSAVICLNYAPTGREFVTGSFDKSIRIFNVEESHSRDVYHGKRMFKVNTVLWTGDNKYVLSGSSDHNVRLWKARASEKLGVMREREQTAINYAEELKERYGHLPEIGRIKRYRHLPKSIYKSKKEMEKIRESQARKESNRRRHSKPGSIPFVPQVQRPVVGVQDELAPDMQDDDA